MASDKPTRADARFLLAHHPRRAVVLPAVSGWRESLKQAGIDVTADLRPEAELVAAGVDSLDRALAADPRAIVVDGDAATRLRSAGFVASRFLVLSDDLPSLFVPLDDPVHARYALGRLRRPGSTLRRLRQLADVRWPRTAAIGRADRVMTVAERAPLRPFLVAAAERLGFGTADAWLLAANEPRPRARNVLHLFEAGEDAPSRVLKFDRLAGGARNDEPGLSLARSAGDSVAAHVPEFVGSFVEDGFAASIETAAVGTPLDALLRSPIGRRRKIELLSSLVGWQEELARRTVERRPGELERQFAEADLLEVGLGELGELRDVPIVLQHFDLAPANVLFSNSDFTVVDWEHARHGLPLLDVVRLLQTSLPLLDGVGGTADDLAAYLVSVFAGAHSTSGLAGGWIRSVAAASGVGEALLGRLVILAWLKLGKRDLLAAWLGDPRLGAAWRPP